MHQLAYVQACIRIAYSQADNAKLLWTLDPPTYSSQMNFAMKQLFLIRDFKVKSPFAQYYTYRKGSIGFHDDMERCLGEKFWIAM